MSGSILYCCHNWVHQLLIGYSLVKLLHGWLGTIVTRNIFSKQTVYPSFPWNYCGLAASYSFIKIVPCCINQICCVSLGFFVLKLWFLLTRVEVKLSVWLPKWMSSKGVVSSLFMAPSLWSFGPKKAALNCFCCLLGRCHSVCKIHNIPFVFVQSVLDLLCQ